MKIIMQHLTILLSFNWLSKINEISKVVTLVLLGGIYLQSHAESNISPNLIDDLLEDQQRNRTVEVQKHEAVRKLMRENCKLPFRNQAYLVTEAAEHLQVHPSFIAIASSDVSIFEDKTFCQVQIHHPKGICRIDVNFEKNGSLKISYSTFRTGTCD